MQSKSADTHEPRVHVAIDIARGFAAAGVLLSAAVHLNLWDVEHYRQIATIGTLFLLNAIGGLVIGVGVVAWRHWLPALAAAGYGAITVAAFWFTVVHGMFGFKEVATGSAQTLAQIAEYTAAVFGLAAAFGLWTMRHASAFQGRSVEASGHWRNRPHGRVSLHGHG